MIVLILVVIFLLPIELLFLHVNYHANNHIKAIQNLPSSKYALVLGAGLERTGSPSDILKDRIQAGVKLIKFNKVEKLILSGTRKSSEYDEPAAMFNYAKQLGINDSEISLDHCGYSTLDSIINNKNQFHLRELIIVTQPFHLPRAIWLSQNLDIITYGFSAENFRFSFCKTFFWKIRELFALPYNFIRLLCLKMMQESK